MSKGKTLSIAAAALVAGLVLGSFGIASAATSQSPTSTATGGFGARLGGICREAGASLADVVAKLTGKTTEDVYAERQGGKSFADIAAAEDVTADEIAKATIEARKSALDAAVADGRISQEQADDMLSRMSDRITDRVNSTGACGGGGGGRGRMGGGGVNAPQ